MDDLRLKYIKAISDARDENALEDVRLAALGKKGEVSLQMRELGKMTPEERKVAGPTLNALKDELNSAINAKKTALADTVLNARLETEWLDVTLPSRATNIGSVHPISQVTEEVIAIFADMGFSVAEGPRIETDWYNFDALNIPEHHPARDMQDTFWLDGGLLLRSHTTTVQARVLGSNPSLPLRVASMGRVYRNEAVDATHLAMFHQLEGIWVDKGLTFAHLKGTLAFIAKSLYGDSPIRFKPKFYPYTEPSVGVDLQCALCHGKGCSSCHGAGWVTILGAGMIHPKVFETFGFDPKEVSGIAFGLGTTRMASQLVNAPTLRPMYDQDLSLLHAIHRGS